MAIDEVKARQLEAAGDKEKALKAWTILGRFQDAARVAWSLGRHVEAADLALKGGLYYEAAMCFIEGRDLERAFNCLLRVSFQHARFRESCVSAAQIAAKSGRVDVRLESFLGPWIQGAPRDEAEMSALCDLATLYAQHGFKDFAIHALAKVVDRDAGFRNAAKSLGALRGGLPMPKSAPPLRVPSTGDASEGELLSEEDFAHLYSSAESTMVRRFAAPVVQANVDVTEGPASAPVAIERDSTAISRLGPGAELGDGERYKLLESLGKGSTAVVYRAHDKVLNTDVALKLFTSTTEGEEAEERFRREVQLSRQLTHPNIVRVFDVGLFEQHKFMTLELLSGQDFASLIKAQGTFTLDEGLRLLMQACEGLAYAHAQNVVHRDVKPGNLFRTDDGVVKLMDFGIAKQRFAKGVTLSGRFMGTPEYMAPEQIADFANADFSSDLYALGVVAYEMFTGQVPFQSTELMSLLMMHMTDVPRAPSGLNAEVPPALDAAILKLLSKKPVERFKNASDLAAELDVIMAIVGGA